MANQMTVEERDALIDAIAYVLEDSAWGIADENARILTGGLIADRIEHDLRQLGWMPPAKTIRIFGRIGAWCADMAKLPEHHINRDTLNSQMAELAQILHDD